MIGSAQCFDIAFDIVFMSTLGFAKVRTRYKAASQFSVLTLLSLPDYTSCPVFYKCVVIFFITTGFMVFNYHNVLSELKKALEYAHRILSQLIRSYIIAWHYVYLTDML